MEYTVQALAKLAGVSARTLRYYDSIGLLRPARIATSGYRIYGPCEVDRLQQILFYRELDVPLGTIGELLDRPDFDRLAALREHYRQLVCKRARMDTLIDTLRQSIAAQEGGTDMDDQQKFMGLKREQIDRNEEQYGGEIREQYGDAAVDASNARLMGLTQDQFAAMEQSGEEVLRRLDALFAAGDSPNGEAGRLLALAHRQWLRFSWPQYSPEAHMGLAEMYVGDPRFAAYYDRGTAGKAQALHDAIRHWAPLLPQDSAAED